MDLGLPELNKYTLEETFIPDARGARDYKPIQYIISNKGCWECVSHAAPSQRGGYPVVTRYGKFWRMSRYVFYITNGFIEEGKYVLHSCDNPKCINPSHLSLGTPKENTQDMIQKGRKPVGEEVTTAKLTENDVKDIYNDQRGCTTIAKEYGVSKKTVLNIRHGKTWKHLRLTQNNSTGTEEAKL